MGVGFAVGRGVIRGVTTGLLVGAGVGSVAVGIGSRDSGGADSDGDGVTTTAGSDGVGAAVMMTAAELSGVAVSPRTSPLGFWSIPGSNAAANSRTTANPATATNVSRYSPRRSAAGGGAAGFFSTATGATGTAIGVADAAAPDPATTIRVGCLMTGPAGSASGTAIDAATGADEADADGTDAPTVAATAATPAATPGSCGAAPIRLATTSASR